MHTHKKPIPSFAILLDNLFKSQLNPRTGREFTYAEVERGLDGKLDESYIRKVRMGHIRNPGWEAVFLLCSFFKVEVSYFYPGLTHEPLETPQVDPLITALQARGLTRQQQKIVENLIREFEQRTGAEDG